MKPLTAICLSTALVLVAGAGCKQPTVNPTGSWEVTVIATNSQARPTAQTLTLKFDSGALTGTLTYNSGPVVNGKAPVSELPITEAKLVGSEISFNFTHPPAVGNGPNATYRYEGKISGDTIAGTSTIEWMGETHTRNWEAQRHKE